MEVNHNRLMIVWTVHPLDDYRGFVNTRVQMALGLGLPGMASAN